MGQEQNRERATITCNEWVLHEITRVKAESDGFAALLDNDGRAVKREDDIYYLFSLLRHFCPLPEETAETKADRARRRKELES